MSKSASGRCCGRLMPGRFSESAAGVVAVCAGAALLAAAPPSAAQPSMDGEFGLWIHSTADSLHVHWLMETPAPGRLIVSAGDVDSVFETPAGAAHRVALVRPTDDRVLLRYGSRGDDAALHRTFIELGEPVRPAVEFEAVDSLFIVGDTHGAHDALVSGLLAADLIDEHGAWIGGRRHLVLAGDLMDRGPDVVGLLWFVYRLEREASEAGGMIHTLLGNHEIMVLLGDLRYVHPKEQLIAEMHGVAYDRMFDVRHSVLGRWLASKPAAIQIGRVLIVHGGLRPEHVQPSLQALDDTLRTYVSEELFHKWADSTAAPIEMDSLTYQRREDFFFAPNSVFWYRAYVQTDTAGPELDEVLHLRDADLLVVGHTAVVEMHVRYDGRLLPAHTPRFGSELLLLVREPGGLRRFLVAGHGVHELH
jgi:hypothetical protein